MKIICSKCGEVFESLILDQEIAFKDVLTHSMKHCNKKHREQFELVGKAVAIGMANLTNFMYIDEFVLIPEDEMLISEKVEKMIETVMLGVGYDPKEDDNDEEEDLETLGYQKQEDMEGETPDDAVGEVIELDPTEEVPEMEVIKDAN